MLGEQALDFGAAFEQHVGDARRKALALADLPQQARQIADRRLARGLEEMALAVEKPGARMCHDQNLPQSFNPRSAGNTAIRRDEFLTRRIVGQSGGNFSVENH
jgi:hypothetical protein